MVVVALDRTVGIAPAGAIECFEDRFLHAGLADRAGHADDRPARPLARGGTQLFQRLGGIGDKDVRPLDRAVDHDCRRTLGEGAFNEAMAVHRFALEREEQVAGLNVAAVDFDAGYREVAACRATRHPRERGGIPERGRPRGKRVFLDHITGPFEDPGYSIHRTTFPADQTFPWPR